MHGTSLTALCAAAGIFVSTSGAQDVRITNLAATARLQWVDVALPHAVAATLPTLCRLDPHGFAMVKGIDVGTHSTLFHVLANLDAGQSVTGTITALSNDPAACAPFNMSDWVADDMLGVLPIPALRDLNGTEHRFVPYGLGVVEGSSPARRVVHLRGRLCGTPLIYDCHLYVYSCQDVVRFECTLTNSDPTTPALSFDLRALWLEVAEFPHVDYRVRLGLADPFRQESSVGHPSYGKYVQVLSGTRVIGRGEQLHFRGSMLCVPDSTQSQLEESHQSLVGTQTFTLNDRVETLQAEGELPALGVYLGWQDHWLAFGRTPELPASATGGGWNHANASWSAFANLLTQPADLYTQRPRGLNRHASNTGAQEDFGASKGSFAVTVGDPRFLHELGYSVDEVFLRPFHYREADGTPLRAGNHPGLQTWSQIINCRTTSDTVGLNCPLPYNWPSNGWSGFDDQHRSQNNFHALLALTGSHALRAQLRDLAEIDMTQVPNRMDSPRAEGRLGIAWANMLRLLDEPADRNNLLAHVGNRTAVIQSRWLGGPFVNDPLRPVRVLATGMDPTFRDGNNEPVTAIIVWENSIAAMGFHALWRTTGDARHRLLAAEISRTIVNHCLFQENGGWIACTAVRYLEGAQEGQALPAASYYSGSPDIHLGVSFWTWILPSVLICRELHQNDAALVARCNAILQSQVPNGPSDWMRSEWWAVLAR